MSSFHVALSLKPINPIELKLEQTESKENLIPINTVLDVLCNKGYLVWGASSKDWSNNNYLEQFKRLNSKAGSLLSVTELSLPTGVLLGSERSLNSSNGNTISNSIIKYKLALFRKQ